MKQKEALFRKQDVLAWRVDREHQIQAERVKTDPVQAYQYILPDVFKLNSISKLGYRLLRR
jgi:phosphoglucomutase